jgi:DNA-binding LacI/PurR family transcriptional regulator
MNARTSSVGLVIRRSPRQFAAEPFYGELVSGLEDVLSPPGLQVLMHVVDSMDAELGAYRRWAEKRTVKAVVLVDVIPDDPRPNLVSDIGLPAVIVGEPEPSVTISSIRGDNYGTMRDAVARLVDLGHEHLGHITGMISLVHTRERARAFSEAAKEQGLRILVEEGDYSAESGAAATRRLLELEDPPTAVIYDNDIMAIAGLEVAHELGVAVPGQLSILAWDDSPLCRLADPPLSVMSRDTHAYGAQAGRLLLETLDGARPQTAFTPSAVFVARGSTAALTPVAEARL